MISDVGGDTACSYWFGNQPSSLVESLVRYGIFPYLSIGWAIRRGQALASQTKPFVIYVLVMSVLWHGTRTLVSIYLPSLPHNMIDTVRREGSGRRTQGPTTCDSPDGTRTPANPRRRWQGEPTSYSHADADKPGHTGRTASRDSQLSFNPFDNVWVQLV